MELGRLPYSIDFRPIGACNLRCPFCFGPRHTLPTMPTRDALKVIDFVATHGTKAIVISGGEPTLIKELPLLLQSMKQHGIKTILSTNGLLLSKRIGEIAPLLDWVALPVDSHLPGVNQKMRVGDQESLNVVLHLITKIRLTYPLLKIKLGTVISRINLEYFDGIPSLFRNEAMPDVWKIYQVSYSNYGKDNKNLLAISDAEFESAVARAQYRASEVGIRVEVYRNSERNGKYLFVDPNGDAITISNGDELTIGNILSNPQTILDTWRNYIDETRLVSNLNSTYPDQ